MAINERRGKLSASFNASPGNSLEEFAKRERKKTTSDRKIRSGITRPLIFCLAFRTPSIMEVRYENWRIHRSRWPLI